ncbi:unnamed protein product [Nippostrongylus brasiliensis]|uniref:Putative ammonium transporter 3 (inferred by orthology to a C. elegans protein) n=1 Tax=Nippostrongylus brasiliensis TaxID=27835 RepID=A0A158R2K0_NIPBR|nr:unnamed protein product [Nippostrongylus brasiliensis]
MGESAPLNTSAMQIVQIHHYAINHNSSEVDKLYQDDAVWIITSSFIIFTMHSGFGLLESGSVSAKDEVNIMVKNVVDVVFGGLSYWSVGYGLSYGDYEPFRNSFIGFGRFFYDPTRDVTTVNEEGWSYAAFLFQLSLATTASTIVSGAVAERAKLKSYILLGCLVILIQALPAHWVWDSEGIFYKLGVVDFAGCSAVSMLCKFRHLLFGAIMFFRFSAFSKRPCFENNNLSALCAVSRPWHALIVGSVSAGFSISILPLLERFQVDDPVGIVPIHLTSSIWGMMAVGIFCEKDRHLYGATNGHAGLLYSGDFTLLGVQLLCTVTVLVYSATFGLLVLVLISKSPLGLRVTDYEEQIELPDVTAFRTFQTVTKAITKWKMLAKTKSRSKRMEQARQKRLTEDQVLTTGGATANGANGGTPHSTHSTSDSYNN